MSSSSPGTRSALIVAVALAAAAPAGAERRREPYRVLAAGERTRHVMLDFGGASPPPEALACLSSRGFVFDSYEVAKTVHIQSVTRAEEELIRRCPGVAGVLPEPRLRSIGPAAQEEACTAAPIQPGIVQIGADRVGALGDGILVASLDTGVQRDHPALAAGYANAWRDATNPDAAPGGVPYDDTGHGTHTVGTVLGRNVSLGNTPNARIGVAPNARWVACKMLGADGEGSWSEALDCAEWVLTLSPKPDIVVNSWGGSLSPTDPLVGQFRDVFARWRAKGILPVFAAGNAGPDCGTAGFPGYLPEVLSVGAVNRQDVVADFSSRGPGPLGGEIQPAVTAPGVNILSSWPGGRYACADGTSMAAPHVAGAVALLWSAAKPYRGDVEKTIKLMKDTAKPLSFIPPGATACGGVNGVPNHAYGHGRVDIVAAIQAATAPPPPPPDTTPPTVALRAPAPGSVLSGTASLAADAADNVGVAGVRFRVDGADVGAEDATAPYALDWPTAAVSDGPHTLTAVARDAAGNSAVSAPVSVEVKNAAPPPPESKGVRIVSPPGGGPVRRAVHVRASATGGAALAAVEFYVDGALQRRDATPPFGFRWHTRLERPGTHRVEARALDTSGAVFIDAIEVSVLNGDADEPSVRLAPSDEARVAGDVRVAAQAEDDDELARVEFFLDDRLLATDRLAPYGFQWDASALEQGSVHRLKAVAYDYAGRSAAAESRVVIDAAALPPPPPPPPPSITLTAPSPVAAGTVVTVLAQVGDGVDWIAFALVEPGGGETALMPECAAVTVAGGRAACAWSIPAQLSGQRTLRAHAYVGEEDRAQASLEITVNPKSPPPPPPAAITLSAPASAAAGQTISLVATASGGIERVRFGVVASGSIETVLPGCVNVVVGAATGRADCAWAIPSHLRGPMTLRAHGLIGAQQKALASHAITVDPPLAPSVVLAGPETALPGQTLTFTASTVGAIDRVAFAIMTVNAVPLLPGCESVAVASDGRASCAWKVPAGLKGSQAIKAAGYLKTELKAYDWHFMEVGVSAQASAPPSAERAEDIGGWIDFPAETVPAGRTLAFESRSVDPRLFEGGAPPLARLVSGLNEVYAVERAASASVDRTADDFGLTPSRVRSRVALRFDPSRAKDASRLAVAFRRYGPAETWRLLEGADLDAGSSLVRVAWDQEGFYVVLQGEPPPPPPPPPPSSAAADAESYVRPNPATWPADPIFHIGAPPGSSGVRVSVFTLSGRRVEVLERSGPPAAGAAGLAYELPWRAAGAASGAYVALVELQPSGPGPRQRLKFTVIR